MKASKTGADSQVLQQLVTTASSIIEMRLIRWCFKRDARSRHSRFSLSLCIMWHFIFFTSFLYCRMNVSNDGGQTE